MTIEPSGTWRMLAFGVVLALFANPAQANQLYRADTRPPGVVFAEGFVGPGSNVNLLMHLSGTPCLGANGAAEWTTAYVSMTEREADLVNYATYVYRIVPDADSPVETATYDVGRGLFDLFTGWQGYGLNLRHHEQIDVLLSVPSIHVQHVARRVAPESIESVGVFEYDTTRNESVFVRRQFNPRYRGPNRAGSRATFSPGMIDGIRTGGHPTQIHTVSDSRGEGAQGLCLLPSGSCFERTPHRVSVQSSGLFPHPATCVVQPAMSPGGLFRQALQIVLD